MVVLLLIVGFPVSILRENANIFYNTVIRWAGFKVSAVELEEAIETLPYIDKVMVVPVPDLLCHQRVGAITWTRAGADDISLTRLRNDLYHSGVSQYKLPTVLYRALPGDLFPSTATGKPAKKRALKIYFPDQYQSTIADGRIEVHVKPGSDQHIPGLQPATFMPLSRRAWDQGGVYY